MTFRDFNDEGPGTFEWDYVLGGNTTGLFPEETHYVLEGDVKNGDTVLTADGGIYTVTVGNADIVITASVVEKTYSLTLPDGMVVWSAEPAAIDGKYPVGTIIQFKIKSEDYVLEGDVMNGDEVLEANAQGIYTVTVGNADIMITVIITLTGGNYTAKNCDELTGSPDGTVTIADGASITLSDVTINGGIVCEGTATIILVGTNSVTGLQGKAGIQVAENRAPSVEVAVGGHQVQQPIGICCPSSHYECGFPFQDGTFKVEAARQQAESE